MRFFFGKVKPMAGFVAQTRFSQTNSIAESGFADIIGPTGSRHKGFIYSRMVD